MYIFFRVERHEINDKTSIKQKEEKIDVGEKHKRALSIVGITVLLLTLIGLINATDGELTFNSVINESFSLFISVIFFANILAYTLVLIFSIFKTNINLTSKQSQRMINYSAGFYLIFSSYISFGNNIDGLAQIMNDSIISDLFISVVYIITHSLSFFFMILLLINILYNLSINLKSFLETEFYKKIYTKFSEFNLLYLIKCNRERCYERYKTNEQAKVLSGTIYIFWLFLEVIYEFLHEIIGSIIKFILYLIGFLLALLYSMHDIKLQNIIYIIARLSVVYSISVTFLIFSYYEVVSESGLSFFEFIATIFLLPLIFNEIKEFRERSRSKKHNKESVGKEVERAGEQ